jgi:hypothetical protein
MKSEIENQSAPKGDSLFLHNADVDLPPNGQTDFKKDASGG